MKKAKLRKENSKYVRGIGRLIMQKVFLKVENDNLKEEVERLEGEVERYERVLDIPPAPRLRQLRSLWKVYSNLHPGEDKK
jgi:hypothetical protein